MIGTYECFNCHKSWEFEWEHPDHMTLSELKAKIQVVWHQFTAGHVVSVDYYDPDYNQGRR